MPCAVHCCRLEFGAMSSIAKLFESCFAPVSDDERTIKYVLGTCKFKHGEDAVYRLAKLCQRQHACQLNKTNGYSHLEELDELFRPKLPPQHFGEQTFNQWKVLIDLNFKWRRLKQRKFYLVLLGDMPDFVTSFRTRSGLCFLGVLREFMAKFFCGMEVEILPPMFDVFNHWDIMTRYHKVTGQKQYLVTDIAERLSKYLPKDATSILGVSWTDLFPSEDLNFVLGEAYFRYNTAVFCFGRFEPKLYRNGVPPPPIEHINGFLLYKMIRIVLHEVCHLIGLHHCVYFDCAMNESNSLDMALAQPLFPCPICLRKIQYVCRFRLQDFYSGMLNMCQELEAEFPSEYMERAIMWLQRCIDVIHLDRY
ncbi:archaemetzincin-2-like [Lineus longissimus]|uniref:archaemetzincin-2-like n=1 Tax=Lineus longissimus TaxID=88925 RepID=UPI002B4F7560